MFSRLMLRLFRRWFPPDVIANSVFLIDAPNSFAIKVEKDNKPVFIVDNLMVANDKGFVALIKNINERERAAHQEGYEKGFERGRAWRPGDYY